MAVLANRVGVATSTVGTGTITLGAALGAASVPMPASWQTFAAAGITNGQSVRYLILDSNGAWEYGPGTYTAAGTTLSRPATSMNGSVPGQKSSTGSLLSLTGNAQVFIVALAEDLPAIIGTPVDNQLAIWAGAASLEGDSKLTWDGVNTLTLTPASGAPRISAGSTGVEVKGTVTNDAAPAGFKGEFKQTATTTTTAIAATPTVTTLATLASLPAGDWLVWGSSTVQNATGGPLLLEFEVSFTGVMSGVPPVYITTHVAATSNLAPAILPFRVSKASAGDIIMFARGSAAGITSYNQYIGATRIR